ncbi:MAG: hybrid sensor histidine kinase/response regulator [Polaromonas sp.]|nr:hybrid sensor histidine kinase/response regulator [Polaromonas sp.]
MMTPTGQADTSSEEAATHRNTTLDGTPVLQPQRGAKADLSRTRPLDDARGAADRLAEVFRLAPAFMCVLRGPDLIFETVNDRYLQLVGNRDLIGMPLRQALPEVEGQGYFELAESVYFTGEPFIGADMTVGLQRSPDALPEQRFIDLTFTALRDTSGAISGVLVHGVDQTDRKLAETALRRNEERYRTLFESMDQGFCIVEMIYDERGRAMDYRFIEMNAMFEKHTGLVDAVGKTVLELVPGHDSVWFEVYGRVAATGQPVRFEDEAKAMGRWFDVFANRIGGTGSARVALLFSDITARKRSEEELRRLAADLAEADRRKTHFLATLAHELRNPLAPIRNALGLLARAGSHPPMLEKIRQIMDRQVAHMVHLIDDLLDIARISGGKIELKRERVALGSIVASAIETSLPLIDAERHQLHVDVPEEPLLLDADPVRMAQVLSNILNNAAKYTPVGGAVDLRIRREGEEAVISISDNGVGIPEESLTTVFDMFTQVGKGINRAQGGLGIGLSLVRQLVELHGGSVTAASAGTGRGSTFTVRLPLASTRAGALPG